MVSVPCLSVALAWQSLAGQSHTACLWLAGQPKHCVAAVLDCRGSPQGSGMLIGRSELLELALEALPFDLTSSQQSALTNVLSQMEHDWPPMQCLLQVRRPLAGHARQPGANANSS